MPGSHREVRLPFPDAPVGNCRVCGKPCAPGRRSHVDCRRRFRDLSNYRAATLRDNGERCARCRTTAGPFHADHIRRLKDGGSKEAWNRQVLCEVCHKKKTAAEASVAAAAERGEPVPQQPTFPWRPIVGTVLVVWAVAHLIGEPLYGTLFAAAVGALSLAFLWAQHEGRKKAAAHAALTHVVARATGMSKTTRGLVRVRKWEGRTPEVVEINYDYEVWDDRDEDGVASLLADVERHLDRADMTADVQRSIARITIRPMAAGEAREAPSEPEPQDDARTAMTARLDAAVRAYVKTGDPRLKVTDWDDTGPRVLTIDYPSTFRDDSAETRAGLQAVVNSKAGAGRWRLDWETTADRVTGVRRPPMPSAIPHPVDRPLDPWKIPFATGEDGQDIEWDLNRKPHMLVAGGTGSGKTVLIRTVIAACAQRGFEIRANDPKRIELSGLRGWPGVRQVETDIEGMNDLTEWVYETMYARYADIESGRKDIEDLQPMLFVVDEAREWIDQANAWWKANKERGQTGTEHPAVEQWRSIGRLGRSARIFLLVGIQRPDAKVVGGEARDNYGARVTCGQVSPQGAQMMFGDPGVGIDLPEDAKGRATIDVGTGVREAQVWWTPDPAKPGYKSPLSEQGDRDLTAALRPAQDTRSVA